MADQRGIKRTADGDNPEKKKHAHFTSKQEWSGSLQTQPPSGCTQRYGYFKPMHSILR